MHVYIYGATIYLTLGLMSVVMQWPDATPRLPTWNELGAYVSWRALIWGKPTLPSPMTWDDAMLTHSLIANGCRVRLIWWGWSLPTVIVEAILWPIALAFAVMARSEKNTWLVALVRKHLDAAKARRLLLLSHLAEVDRLVSGRRVQS